MTSTRTTTAPGKGGDSHPCGCAEPQPEVCRLECLEKPKFSCGQLLTDQDLTALVEWSEKKAALARYRHGWGVVCGLDVHRDSSRDGSVTLGPGYAIDCCGQDVLVCHETPVSLDPCCQAEPEPCDKLTAEEAPPGQVNFGGATVSNMRAIDLVLHYDESGSAPRAALGGRNCGDTAMCEYTRTKETFRVTCSIAGGLADPVKSEAETWAEQYGKCLDVVRRYRKEVGASSGPDGGRWLKRWVDKNPPRYFGFLPDWISEAPAEKWTERVSVEVLFWLVQDRRNAFLQCGCYECQEDSGIPIARVWVRLGAAGKSKCQVQAIDTHPPYRRAVHGACWPAPLGQVNAGAAIWRRVDDAAATLSRMGVRLREAVEFHLPDNADALEKMLDTDLVLPWDSVNKLLVFNGGGLGFRVVGIVA